MQNLSKRIQKILSFVSVDSKIVWDLCCDHGIIGLNAKYTGRRVIFLDQVESITNKLASTDIPRSDIILANATNYNFTKNNSRTTYILAGIGGVLSVDILKNIIPILNFKDQIVLSPHNSIPYVRDFLSQSKLRVSLEEVIEDNGQFYEMFCLGTGYKYTVNPLPGELWTYNSDTINYIKDQIAYYTVKSAHSDQYAGVLRHFKSLLSA